MRDDLAKLVHPVLIHGLALLERLEAGEPLNLELEQATLKVLLRTGKAARVPKDFGPAHEEAKAEGLGNGFLGVRYALTCWLDELFLCHSPWAGDWAGRCLEVALYGTGERGRKFWAQARLAEDRGDALEAFHLCVLLGFRGVRRDHPESVEEWLAATRPQLAKNHKPWRPPPELEHLASIPLLRGRKKLERAALACGVLLLVLIPLLTFFLTRTFGE